MPKSSEQAPSGKSWNIDQLERVSVNYMRTFKSDRTKLVPPTKWKYVSMSKDDFPRAVPFAHMAYDPSLIRALFYGLSEEIKNYWSTKFAKFPWNFTVYGDLKDVPSLTEVELNQWTALWYIGDSGIVECRCPEGWPDNFGGQEKTGRSGESAASQSKDKQPISSRDTTPKTVATPVHVSSEGENVPKDNTQLHIEDQIPEQSDPTSPPATSSTAAAAKKDASQNDKARKCVVLEPDYFEREERLTKRSKVIFANKKEDVDRLRKELFAAHEKTAQLQEEKEALSKTLQEAQKKVEEAQREMELLRRQTEANTAKSEEEAKRTQDFITQGIIAYRSLEYYAKRNGDEKQIMPIMEEECHNLRQLISDMEEHMEDSLGRNMCSFMWACTRSPRLPFSVILAFFSFHGMS
ncbi:hypothetical protein BS50DRAFT_640962 [Corynespora cassiicola Philippines]|uniref:Uncharacterized protein n=1 Tax=Corynespora cassiicola Philippines TaxID=1448308 RepID=A0A2T2N1U6_CORCC|nr:hypothetical protein BS50DRAFT_640962 [Corynespora cassiicola Philippines]